MARALIMRTLPIFLITTLIACPVAAPRIFPIECPSGTLDELGVRPESDRPRPSSLFIPPVPIPADIRGHRAVLRVVVDSLGRSIPDSTSVCGIPNQQYAAKMVKAVAALRFVPGTTQTSQQGGVTMLEIQF